MTDNPVYLAALNELSEGRLTIRRLLDASNALQKSGSLDLLVSLYKQWIAAETANPLLYVVIFNCALLLRDRGDLRGAREGLEQVVSLKPDFAPGHTALGEIYESLGEGQKAIAQWSVVADQPHVITGSTVESTLLTLKRIGRRLQQNREHAKLAVLLRRGLELNPDDREIAENLISHRLSRCEWPITSAPGADREVLLRKMGPFQLLLYTDDPLLDLASAWDYNKDTVGYPPPCPDVRPRSADPGRLRIGYLSADLRSHSTGYLRSEVFELHDRRKVEVFAYYCGTADPDPTKTRISEAVEHWIDISRMDDQTAARQIAGDGIDILVDLHGNTRGHRTRLLAMRPAPIIVNWLAYPGTMATPYHHYIIADEWIIPKEYEVYYSEKVARLPCYQPNDRKRVIAPQAPTRAVFGLPADALVYCCFNGAIKISRFIFERWMTILARVPNSVLWLLDGGEDMRNRLFEAAVQRGIARERLIFAAAMPRSQHLARYGLADLFLDTVPCGAHTTASDALWMGVPILTVSGHGFASRVCGSLARAAGLPEAVCSSLDDYVERAVALGQDKAELERQKRHLASHRDTCVLFDMENLVSHLEVLYRQMWKEFHQGNRPRPDLRNLDLYFELGVETDHDSVEVQAIKDYQGWYRRRMLERHRGCPIPEDGRLWTAAQVAAADAMDILPPKNPRKPRVGGGRKPASKPKTRRGK